MKNVAMLHLVSSQPIGDSGANTRVLELENKCRQLERENLFIQSEVKELKSVNRQLLQTCQQLNTMVQH